MSAGGGRDAVCAFQVTRGRRSRRRATFSNSMAVESVATLTDRPPGIRSTRPTGQLAAQGSFELDERRSDSVHSTTGRVGAYLRAHASRRSAPHRPRRGRPELHENEVQRCRIRRLLDPDRDGPRRHYGTPQFEEPRAYVGRPGGEAGYLQHKRAARFGGDLVDELGTRTRASGRPATLSGRCPRRRWSGSLSLAALLVQEGGDGERPRRQPKLPEGDPAACEK